MSEWASHTEIALEATLLRQKLIETEISKPGKAFELGRAFDNTSHPAFTTTCCNCSCHSSMSSPAEMMVDKLPPKRQSRLLRNLRHQLFSVYQRLFAFYFIGNAIAVIVYLFSIRATTPNLSSISTVSIVVSSNLLVTGFARTDAAVNCLFIMSCWVPKSAPIRLRRIIAKVYEYGGIHSSAGASTLLWAVVFTGEVTQAYLNQQGVSFAAVALTWLIPWLLIGICVSALPKFRHILHNWFECTHRFAAWTTLLMFWALTLTITNDVATQKTIPFNTAIKTNPSFWLLCIITFLILTPWLYLRKVPVTREHLSSHAVRLHFSYTSAGPAQTIRLSTQPLIEWHTFASIPAGDGTFSVIVSNAGDWTRNNIARTPSHYWVKGIPTTGFINAVNLFKKVAIVTTGSGIAPCLSILIAARNIGKPIDCRLLWSTRDPESTYGKNIMTEVMRADPKARIINTSQLKGKEDRPDMVLETYKLWKESRAEAVLIVSNPALTYKIKYGLESRGVPAYGPIWDS